MEMIQSRPFAKIRAVDSTDTTFATRIPTITEPVDDGVVNLVSGGVLVSCEALIIPYATGNNNATMEIRIIGWKHIGSGPTPTSVLWIPVLLHETRCTLGLSTGIALAPILATQRFTDTITATTIIAQEKTIDTDSGGAASSGSIWISSPASDLIATIRVLLNGWEKLEIIFDSTAATTTDMNCLYAWI